MNKSDLMALACEKSKAKKRNEKTKRNRGLSRKNFVCRLFRFFGNFQNFTNVHRVKILFGIEFIHDRRVEERGLVERLSKQLASDDRKTRFVKIHGTVADRGMKICISDFVLAASRMRSAVVQSRTVLGRIEEGKADLVGTVDKFFCETLRADKTEKYIFAP